MGFDLLWLALRDPAARTFVFAQGQEKEWLARAREFADTVGNPVATLDTAHLKRFLFHDGTSVDLLLQPIPGNPPFVPKVLIQHILPFWENPDPLTRASYWARNICGEDANLWAHTLPDPAFRQGDIVLVLLPDDKEMGWGHIFRRHALRIRGPKPKLFRGWPTI